MKQDCSPLFDLSALTGVQTALGSHRGERDPWASQLIGDFANLAVFNDNLRFSFPVPSNDLSFESRLVIEPRTLNILADAMGESLSPVPYSTDAIRPYSDGSIEDCVLYFDKWARRHRASLKTFCRLHMSDIVARDQNVRVANIYTFDVAGLRASEPFRRLEKLTGIPRSELIYAFDLSLRMPMYGSFAGPNQYYLNHPIRDAFGGQLVTEVGPAAKQSIPFSLSKSFSDLAPRLSQQEFVSSIMLLREEVRRHGLVGAEPGDFDKEILRDIAANCRLPGRLRYGENVPEIVAIVLSAIAANAVAGLPGAMVGASISVAGSIWKPPSTQIAAKAADISWLRWAVKWDIEDQKT